MRGGRQAEARLAGVLQVAAQVGDVRETHVGGGFGAGVACGSPAWAVSVRVAKSQLICKEQLAIGTGEIGNFFWRLGAYRTEVLRRLGPSAIDLFFVVGGEIELATWQLKPSPASPGIRPPKNFPAAEKLLAPAKGALTQSFSGVGLLVSGGESRGPDSQ